MHESDRVNRAPFFIVAVAVVGWSLLEVIQIKVVCSLFICACRACPRRPAVSVSLVYLFFVLYSWGGAHEGAVE